MNRPLLFSLSGSEALAQPLSAALDAEVGTIEHRQFPDGETYLRVGNDVSDREVILLSSLDHPDAKLLPLLFAADTARSEEHTSELQSLMRISYAVFCLKKKKQNQKLRTTNN